MAFKTELAEKAKKHNEFVLANYQEEIATCTASSKIYSAFPLTDLLEGKNKTEIKVTAQDSVSAIIDNYNDGRVCVLNYASFKTPGGYFLGGSAAQEEALCHESILFNVISGLPDFYEKNHTMLNNALYDNRAIYSPYVLFMRDNWEGKVDVLTCAAPNKYAAQKYKNVSNDENSKALYSRIDFVLNVLADNTPDVLVLGAYGCGVFGQDAREVASIFKYLLERKYLNVFKKVIFAIPDKNSYNYRMFEEEFNG